MTEPTTVEVRRARSASSAGTAAAIDLRLARLHLRLGMVGAARAELEDLDGRGALDRNGLAALAEARWRSGDLEAAGDAARAHLEAGGNDAIATVIAAEDSAVAGDVAATRELMARLSRLDAAALDAIFAGLPRRAHWPAAAGGAAPELPPSLSVTGSQPVALPPGQPAAGGRPAEDREAGQTRSLPGPAEVMAATRALWDEVAGAARGAGQAVSVGRGGARDAARPRGHADPERELNVAREELEDAPQRGFLRLALVLRLDPTLAPDVLEAVRLRREPAAAILRGDAERLVGRHLEAEAAFADAAEGLEREAQAAYHPAASTISQEDS